MVSGNHHMEIKMQHLHQLCEHVGKTIKVKKIVFKMWINLTLFVMPELKPTLNKNVKNKVIKETDNL